MSASEITRIDPIGRLSKVVVVNGGVYLSGLTSRNKELDVKVQTADILKQIEEYLEKAGSSKERLIRVNIWLNNIDDFDAMNSVWDTWVNKDHQPARATVESRLAAGGNLVEMMATAVV
ncbi:RidA family protein [Agrobacterium larrymoorei]|uniref:RidA family protein n=1 Tax=Agrobacterium larrymoorei TaxID=160699 RepID=A0A4D7E4T2_9HYPH|nr:RidA family protein [Agrobacterium larrymoorei]QCJ01097.1 RidA family protein [Agrobacterium larrymoorei]QYA10111.1 RidA family protein [Agrobacterium larrymoorei]